MRVSEDTNCVQCNLKVINYPNQFCRRQFLPPSQIDGVRKDASNKFSKLFKTNLFKKKLFKTKLFKTKLFKTKLSKTKLFKTDSESPKNESTDDETSENFIKLDEFIKETQLNSKYCDDFIEWIPRLNLENVKYITNGGSSKIYFGTWNLLLNTSLASIALKQISSKVALKAIDDSNDHILNEVRKIK
jgi:hypothetical protein